MRRICVVITARASYARVKSLLRAIELHPDLVLVIVTVTVGPPEKFGMLAAQIRADGFVVTNEIACPCESDTRADAAICTGRVIVKLTRFFADASLAVIVTIADRFETMATAIAASYLNIPLAHIQGGEVSGNIDEKVRHAVTKLADLHFVATSIAKQRVIKLGESPASVFLTGCPAIDLVFSMNRNVVGELPYDCHKNKYIIVLQHPVSRCPGLSGDQFFTTLTAARRVGLPILCFSPNADPGNEAIFSGIENQSMEIRFLRSVPAETFLLLLKHCACLVGNSSVGIREAGCMGVPVVNVGDRQQGRERASNVIDADFSVDIIFEAMLKQIGKGIYEQSFLYGNGHAGEQIARLLADESLTSHKILSY